MEIPEALKVLNSSIKTVSIIPHSLNIQSTQGFVLTESFEIINQN